MVSCRIGLDLDDPLPIEILFTLPDVWIKDEYDVHDDMLLVIGMQDETGLDI
jgi:hypothetical protein